VALGSVAEELLRTAPCPVMTIGPKAAASARKPLDFRSILFSTDFGAGSTKALPLVLQMVRAHQAKLILVHIIPPLPVASSIVSAYAPAAPAADEVQEWEASAAKRTVQNLRDWIAPYGHLQPEPEYIVGADFLAEGIFAAAGEFNAGLIVMGTKRSPSARVSAHLPWTAVHQVLHDAHCPVLSVAG
ncbi:MAG TPA: universal stress protein, partial [Candidatus Sulfotelmatobacter sp.]|nr:universal stress protein [Candidatus Sulfotelmatobacter sp.]